MVERTQEGYRYTKRGLTEQDICGIVPIMPGKTKSKLAKQIKVEIIPARTFEIKPGHKYLIVAPFTSEGDLSGLQPALTKFFGESKVLMIATDKADQVKIAEYMDSED